MPPSLDQTGQEQLLNLDPDLREGTRRRSPKGKKNRRKHESREENTTKWPESNPLDIHINPPSSILAELQKAPPPLAPARPSSPTPLLESWDAPPTRFQGFDTPQKDTSPLTGAVNSDRKPTQSQSNGIHGIASSPVSQREAAPVRGGFYNASPPTSPRAAIRVPNILNNEPQSLGGYPGFTPQNYHEKPSAAFSHPQDVSPPPPHHAQPHFYGAPDLDFRTPRTYSKRGEPEEVFSVLDSFQSQAIYNAPRKVLIQGYDHCLDVYHVRKKRLSHIGRLVDIRGRVIGAKMLPPESVPSELREMQPLVAVISHGPRITNDQTAPETAQMSDIEHNSTQTKSQAQRTYTPDTYQTAVDVYSLGMGIHVQTLFTCPSVGVESRPYGPPIAPPASGDLHLQAKGRFITVSSGKSGEIIVFCGVSDDDVPSSIPFKCIGKVWTKTSGTRSRSLSVSSSGSDALGANDDGSIDVTQSAIMSLSARWLAYVPPSSSSQTTLHGTVTERHHDHIRGFASHTSPAEPHVTCQLDVPDAPGLLSKVARDSAQGLMKGAYWAGSQGMQAWKQWYSPKEQLQPNTAGSPPSNAGMGQPQSFPPTHAHDATAKATQKQSARVSVLDLEKLSRSQHSSAAVALHPLATFEQPSGCSFLAFSPDGLMLFTATSKGDIQHVWDLKRMIYGSTASVRGRLTALPGPSVREVARFSRLTEARIVDVAWTEPRGARLAIVTENGTAHIWDLPPSALQWPPPNRLEKSTNGASKPVDSDNTENNVPQRSAGSSITSAFEKLSSTTSPILAAVRGRRPSSSSAFPSLSGIAGAGAQSGRMVANGVSRSVSMAAVGTFSTLSHLGDNRVKLPLTSTPFTSGCIQWHCSKGQNALVVVGGDTVEIYTVRSGSTFKSGRQRPSVMGNPVKLTVPKSSDSSSNDAGIQPQEADQASSSSFWHCPQPRARPHPAKDDPSSVHNAEIDTNAAYQPFHTDRRVNQYIYSHSSDSSSGKKDPHHLYPSSSIWAFGEPIPVTKISSGSADHEDSDAAEGQQGQIESNIQMAGEGEENQHVTVTSRRKRDRRRSESLDEGGGGPPPGEETLEDEFNVVEFEDMRV